jgi:crotonobetainyl-CoA:carnitine CoA-transferase CaiB-like acyl-CoA transferase
MTASLSRHALGEIWHAAGHDEAALAAVDLAGAEPVLPSSFAVGTAAQATIAAAALAAAELWRLRSGRSQRVSVDMRSAAIEFRSERYLRVDGRPPAEYHDPIAGLYRCGDGRWVRLHTNLPHHRDGLLGLLGCAHEPMAVQRALDGWRGEALEAAAAEAGLVVTACRSFAEWDEHAQGRAIARLPLFTIDRIGDAPAQPLPPADRPLAGVKVLDLTRIIAGPVCGRTLAVHGADVLLITASHLPSMQPLVIDTGRGKLSAHIDLRQPSGREALASLLRDADVFVQVTGRAPLPRSASARKMSHGSGPASSTSPSALTGMKARGRAAAGSTRLSRQRAASMPRKRTLAVRASRDLSRLKCSTTPRATSWRSRLCRRSRAVLRKEAAGTFESLSRRPATGFASSAAWMASVVRIPASMTSAIAWKTRRLASGG